jgi:hypothetical protein
MLAKKLSNSHIYIQCYIQWGPLVYVLDCRVRAVLEKKPGDLHISGIRT